jgi:hypothetical protein
MCCALNLSDELHMILIVFQLYILQIKDTTLSVVL